MHSCCRPQSTGRLQGQRLQRCLAQLTRLGACCARQSLRRKRHGRCRKLLSQVTFRRGRSLAPGRLGQGQSLLHVFLVDLPGRKPLLPQHPPQAAPVPLHHQLLRGMLQGSGQSPHSHSERGGGGLSRASPKHSAFPRPGLGTPLPSPARAGVGGGKCSRSIACVSRVLKAVLLQTPAPAWWRCIGEPRTIMAWPPAGQKATGTPRPAPRNAVKNWPLRSCCPAEA